MVDAQQGQVAWDRARRGSPDAWRQNLRDNLVKLEALVGAEDVRRFDLYLRVSTRALRSETMTVEVTVFEKRR